MALNIDVLYSSPLTVRDTRVWIDGEVVMEFQEVEIPKFPPHLGSRKIPLSKGPHTVRVVDNNFGLEKTESFEMKEESWIEIVIHDDSVSIHKLDRDPGYK
jgi:hypothetical protein